MADMDVAAAYAVGDSYEAPAPRRHVRRDLADEVSTKLRPCSSFCERLHLAAAWRK